MATTGAQPPGFPYRKFLHPPRAGRDKVCHTNSRYRLLCSPPAPRLAFGLVVPSLSKTVERGPWTMAAERPLWRMAAEVARFSRHDDVSCKPARVVSNPQSRAS